MRNFDNWIRYQDNDRNPLHGCIQFNVKDGNTVAPIYDSDGTALANPQVTDTYGRTKHQVFVDTDVVAYFYKYIGQGVWSNETDIDTSDVSKWALQYTSESILNVLSNIQSDMAVAIANVAALRAVDVEDIPAVNEQKVITLMGYFAQGDKEPINYIWNPESTEQDNGGSVIKSDNLITGRWIMVQPTEHVDSRHFGAFPSNSSNMDDQTYQIGQLITYCYNHGLRPFFNGSNDYAWFKYSNLNAVSKVIDVSTGTKFMDLGNNTIQGEWNGNPLFNSSNTNLVAKEVKTSWGARLFIGPEHVIIDSDALLLQTTYSNCIVDVNVTTGKTISFTNCTVNVNKSLTGVCAFSNCIINSKNMLMAGSHFVNCKLTEDMFYGSPIIHVDGNCIADFNDFEHKQLMWLRIKDQQNQINYDWEGVLTEQNPWEGVVDSDRWLLNYKSVNPNAVLKESTAAHVYYIENCAGNITLEGKAANTYVFKNCEMTVKFADGFNAGSSVRLQNSTINIGQSRINLENLNCQDSSIIGNGSFDVVHAYLYNSVISAPVYCGYCDVKDCNIANTIQVYGIDQDNEITVDSDPAATGTHAIYHVHRIISGNFVNNFVSGQIEIGTVDYNDPHITTADLVRGMNITDNVGLSPNPIVVNRSFSSVYDNYNIYTYKGNTGTMEMKTNGIDLVLIEDSNVAGMRQMYNQSGLYVYSTDTTGPCFEISLFTIGTRNVVTKVMTSTVNDHGAGLGYVGGIIANPDSEGSPNKPMSKTATSQFSWGIYNMPLAVGVAVMSYGDHQSFDFEQV